MGSGCDCSRNILALAVWWLVFSFGGMLGNVEKALI
jgi:hypothetical protein